MDRRSEIQFNNDMLGYNSVMMDLKLTMTRYRLNKEKDFNKLIEKTGCPSCRCIMEHLIKINEKETTRNNYKIAEMLYKLHENNEFIHCIGLCKPNSQ